MENQIKEITYKEDLINAVLQYLASKPYAETYQLIAALQQQGKVVEEDKAKVAVKK
jgi:hypothetical protein